MHSSHRSGARPQPAETLTYAQLERMRMSVNEEPEECENCGSSEPMNLLPVEIDGAPATGWICDECGWFHKQTDTPPDQNRNSGSDKGRFSPEADRCECGAHTAYGFGRGHPAHAHYGPWRSKK
jgi:hypothetical protein